MRQANRVNVFSSEKDFGKPCYLCNNRKIIKKQTGTLHDNALYA